MDSDFNYREDFLWVKFLSASMTISTTHVYTLTGNMFTRLTFNLVHKFSVTVTMKKPTVFQQNLCFEFWVNFLTFNTKCQSHI